VRPDRLEVFGQWQRNFLCESGAGDADLAAGFDELDEVVQVEVVGAEVGVAIVGDDRVEVFGGEGELVGVGTEGDHAAAAFCGRE